ncbi:sporulation integral membrane protein YtvI [Salibacterium qingdaonense]|uniref:Sporulation integral membrane protein YtvI n=1 Tax=Salibacterium qingdaonense TaxID=266892 RepID=A0A1I4ITX2_9BACI|nr:sporulation integral membrane protein YtvI [Salibacterium qingdaonense]SFL57819.1 sporulation integral membrane protein YtvI [Salibacterium qingdaonense]
MPSIFNKKVLLRVLGVLLLLLGAYYILPVSGPIIAALITALFLSPGVRFLHEKWNIKRNISVMIVFVLFLLILALCGYFVTTQLVSQVIFFINNLPGYVSELNEALLSLQSRIDSAYQSMNLPPDTINQINEQIINGLNSYRDALLSYADRIPGVLASIPGFIISLLVYLIALFLFLMDLPRLRRKMYSFMKESTAEKFHFMTSRLSYVILGFFKAQFLVSLIILAVTLVSLYIFTPDVALLMSILIWVVDFIPIIGSIAVLAPWSLYHFIAGDLLLGTQLMVLAIVLLIIRRTVEPKVMGSHIGLSALATLISLYLGLSVLGVVGFIIGPLAVIAFTSAREAGIIKLNFKI